MKQQTFIWLNSWNLIRCQFRWNLGNKVWSHRERSRRWLPSRVVFLTHVVQCKQTLSFHHTTTAPTTTTTALWQALNVTEMCFKKTTKKKNRFMGAVQTFLLRFYSAPSLPFIQFRIITKRLRNVVIKTQEPCELIKLRMHCAWKSPSIVQLSFFYRKILSRCWPVLVLFFLKRFRFSTTYGMPLGVYDQAPSSMTHFFSGFLSCSVFTAAELKLLWDGKEEMQTGTEMCAASAWLAT